jgi:transposase
MVSPGGTEFCQALDTRSVAAAAMVSEALAQMDRKFEKLYSQTGQPSIAPERLIRALLLQVPRDP